MRLLAHVASLLKGIVLSSRLEADVMHRPPSDNFVRIIRERYRLGLDDGDIRLIQLNNLLQLCACICEGAAYITENELLHEAAQIVECLADAAFCCTAGCMTAQIYHEIKLQQRSAPSKMRYHIGPKTTVAMTKKKSCARNLSNSVRRSSMRILYLDLIQKFDDDIAFL